MILKFILLFTCCFSLTYFFTNNSFVPNINSPRDREPSSDVKKETKNSYKNLRCPSEQEFLQWSKELNIDVIAGPSLNEGCKIKNNRSQLAQILALAHDIKINFPKKWAPSVQNEIKSSYEYIRKNTNKLIIDLSQTSSVARNFVAQKQIELGGMFFKEEPIEALSVLIHEARHSDPRDQGHTFCVAGDIPRTAGGCDDYFSNKAENAGAYGYGTLYEFALAKYSANLDAAEKELMLSNAMTALGTRFNKIKSLLAKHSDIITVLLDDGTLAWVHPYSLQLTPLKIELPNYQEKIKKIEFSPRTGSLLLFTVTDRVFMWGPQLKATRPTSEALTETDRVLHSSRQYVPFENDVTYYTHLKTNGKLEYVKYNAELNKQVILPYPLFASGNDPAPKIPYLKYFALALGTNSFFADTKGLLYRAHHYAGQPNFINMTDIQSKTGGWKTLTGGVFYEDLILTDADGKIYETTVSYENPNASSVAPNNSDEEAEYFSVKPAAFQSHNKAKKYHRGLQLHAVIDEDGSLTFENYRVANSRVHLTFNKKIKDLVVTRVTSPDVNIYKSDNVNHTLIRECKIKNEIESVGYGSILAINFESQLISANADHTCTLLLKDKYWDSAEVVNVDVVSTEQEQIKPYPDSYLKLTNQNTKSQWIPYTRSVRTQSK